MQTAPLYWEQFMQTAPLYWEQFVQTVPLYWEQFVGLWYRPRLDVLTGPWSWKGVLFLVTLVQTTQLLVPI